MDTMAQLIAHLVGDYMLQSDWAAAEKTKKSLAALMHVLTYMVPFLILTRNPYTLAVIVGTHFVIDRWRLARYVCWAKNFLAPPHIERKTCGCLPNEGRCPDCGKSTWVRNLPWAECSGTGYGPDKPPFMAVWLMIITDNTMHLICNYLALKYIGV